MPLLLLIGLAAAAGLLTYGVWGRWDRRRVPPTDADGDVARSSALLPAMTALAVAALAVGSLALVVERNTPLRRWDDHVEQWAAAEAGALGTDLLRAITHLGDTVTVISLTVVAVAVVLAVARQPRWALFLTVVVVGQWALANTLKWLVGRPRPELDPLAAFSGNSFPSGHTTAAAATYLALALVVSGIVARADRRLLVAVAVALGVAVGGSRALLGVHWFTDVLAGLLLGWTWCLVVLVVIDPERGRASTARERTASTPRSRSIR